MRTRRDEWAARTFPPARPRARRWLRGLALAVALSSSAALAQKPVELPAGYLPRAESQALLDRTLRVHLDPDLSRLTPAERATVDRLIETGRIFQRLYEDMRHPEALEACAQLLALDRRLGSPVETANLITLYYASKGPIARMLDNARRPFLPVAGPVPGGSVYPPGVTKDEIDAFLAAHPELRATILDPRTVVRRAGKQGLRRDLEVLRDYPVLDALHPGLADALEAMARRPDEKSFYAVPYPVAYPEELTTAHRLLTEAAAIIAPEDEDFAAYLRNRARDLLGNDYESGDAAWVAGRFKTLNAQIGSYETYDDELYGTKTYFGLNVLVIDRTKSDALRTATAQLQRLEDLLPYDEGRPHKRVRADIPVGVYDVVADFAQSRGANTATILPNDAAMARKYGRTILLRRNIMEDAGLFDMSRASFDVAVAEAHRDDYTPGGSSDRTLWHEIGHYLGVDRTRDNRDLDLALEQAAAIYEEMKADLVSLFVAPELRRMGYYDDADLRPLYASGVRRVLLKNRPDRAQVYQTMELMQWNYFMEKGALSFDARDGRLSIHYDRFPDVVASMLREVLEIQSAGDAAAAEAYIAKHSAWREDLHERVAAAMRASERYRYAYVTYEVLDARAGVPGGAPRTAGAARR
jgi:hypothetical protein